MTDSTEKTPSLGTGSAKESRRQNASFGGGQEEGEAEGGTSTMLSVDFSTPLSGTARSERIRQLSHNH
ncbi:hypothetical protein E4U53_005188, partial [Claviceps sorghi]